MPGGAPIRTALDRDGIITILVRTPLTHAKFMSSITNTSEQHHQHKRKEKPKDNNHNEEEEKAQPPALCELAIDDNENDRLANKPYDIAREEWGIDAADNGASVTHYETKKKEPDDGVAALLPTHLASVKTAPTMSMNVGVNNFRELKDNLPVSNYQLPPSIAIRYWTVKAYNFKPYMSVKEEEQYMNKVGSAKMSARNASLADRTMKYATTDLLCWHDCHPIHGIPFPIPWRKSRRYNVYDVYGLFCCPGCARAYNRAHSVIACRDMADTFIIEIAIKYYGCKRATTGFPIAPARETLEAFGGILSIDEFRRLAGYKAETAIDMFLPFEIVPMTFVERSIVGNGNGADVVCKKRESPKQTSSSFDGAFRASTSCDDANDCNASTQKNTCQRRQTASAPDITQQQQQQSPQVRRKFGDGATRGACFGHQPQQKQSPVLLSPSALASSLSPSPPPTFSPVIGASLPSAIVDEASVSAFVHAINVSTRSCVRASPDDGMQFSPVMTGSNKFMDSVLQLGDDCDNENKEEEHKEKDSVAIDGITQPSSTPLPASASPSSSLRFTSADGKYDYGNPDSDLLREAKFNKWKLMRDKYYRGGIPKLPPMKSLATSTRKGDNDASGPASRKRKARASSKPNDANGPDDGGDHAPTAKRRKQTKTSTGGDWRTSMPPDTHNTMPAKVECSGQRQTLALKGKDHGAENIGAVLLGMTDPTAIVSIHDV